MPIEVDHSYLLNEKLKKHEVKIRAKDEKIVALETENAMLYLKLAQLQGQIHSQKEVICNQRRMKALEQKEKIGTNNGLSQLYRQIKVLRSELDTLRQEACTIPVQFTLECQCALEEVRKQSELLTLESSNAEELQKKLLETELLVQTANENHMKEKRRRRALHNTLMELRGNIRVHCRVRPLMDFDRGGDDPSTLGRPGSNSEVIVHPVDDENVYVNSPKHSKAFEFERLYSPSEKQEAVFEEVQPMLTSLLDGYNVCISAYGQTGSGKTHTMLGSHKNEDYNLFHQAQPDEGVIPRAVRELFRLIEEKPAGTHSVEVSVLEIYNNDIRDLLGKDPNIKHDVVTASAGSLHVPTLTSKQVGTVDEVMSLVQHGLRTRCESATLVHEHSSRSHLVVMLTLSTQPSKALSPSTPRTASPTDVFTVPQFPVPRDRSRSLPVSGRLLSRSPSPSRSHTAAGGVVKTKLQLVDLAGSECVGMSGVKGAALREASHINKSLCALADVLGALAENRAHVPYRNSRLTHLLQDSIGGDAKLLVLLCVSPAKRYATETLQTLGFGYRARQVQRGQVRRRSSASSEKNSQAENSATNNGRKSPSYNGRNSPKQRASLPPRLNLSLTQS